MWRESLAGNLVKMDQLRKWFVVLVYALVLFPPCSCYDEAQLLFLEQQPPSVLPMSAESHYRPTVNSETAPAPTVYTVCMCGDDCCLGVVALELFSVNLTYTVLNVAVLSTACGMKTKQHHSRSQSSRL